MTGDKQLIHSLEGDHNKAETMPIEVTANLLSEVIPDTVEFLRWREGVED